MVRRHERVGVRADREERRVAEVEQAGEPHDDVQTDGKEDVHASVRGLRDQEAAAAAGDDLNPDRKGDRAERKEEEHDRVRVLPRVALQDRSEPRSESPHFSGTRIPRRPVGLKTRTRIRIAKMMTCVQVDSMYPSHIAVIRPIRRPPSAAP